MHMTVKRLDYETMEREKINTKTSDSLGLWIDKIDLHKLLYSIAIIYLLFFSFLLFIYWYVFHLHLQSLQIFIKFISMIYWKRINRRISLKYISNRWAIMLLLWNIYPSNLFSFVCCNPNFRMILLFYVDISILMTAFMCKHANVVSCQRCWECIKFDVTLHDTFNLFGDLRNFQFFFLHSSSLIRCFPASFAFVVTLRHSFGGMKKKRYNH